MPTQVRILDLPPARSAPRRGTEQPDGTQVVSSTPCRAPAHPAQAGLLTCGGTTTARLQSWRPDDGPRGKAGRRESAIGSAASRARLVTPGPCTTRACGRSGLLTLLTRYGAVSLGWHTHVIRPTDTPAFQRGQIGSILGGFGKDGFKPLDPNNLQRAIRQAKKAGLLDISSGAECLVVPTHAIEGGWGGRPDSPCPVHVRKVVQRRERSISVGR
jgi:hypothetical protein